MICRLIHDDIEDSDEKTIFKISTFTPIASERVKIGKNYEHTRNTILRGGEPTGTCKIKLPKEKSEIKSGKINAVGWRNVENNTRTAVKRMNANRLSEYVYRWHHRIVYKEFAVPLYKLANLDDMLLVLEHSVEGKLVTLTSTI